MSSASPRPKPLVTSASSRASASCLVRGAALAALALASALVAGSALALEPGDAAPSFAAPALDGGAEVSLDAYRGKVVYLDFWASWCGPCQVSLPQLSKLQQELGDDGFQVVAINVDRDPEKALRVMAQFGLSYPSATDPQGALPATFGIQTMPTAFLIDRQGVIRRVHKGFRDGDLEELRAEIESLMGTVPASPARR